jgi:hypothetical protein
MVASAVGTPAAFTELGSALARVPDQPGGVPDDDAVTGDVARDDRARTDHRVRPYCHSRQQRAAAAYRGSFLDSDSSDYPIGLRLEPSVGSDRARSLVVQQA